MFNKKININSLEIDIKSFRRETLELINSKIIQNIINHVNELLWPLENHYYHHYEHTLEVMYRALYLWEKENLTNNDLELLAIAALFHDTWFIIQYEDNEYIWAKIAWNYLNSILYPKDKIKIIEDIIISTIIDKEPNNLLESIIKDADTDNLGRNDFFDKWKRLRKELETIKNIKFLNPEWYHYSLKFIKEHKFYTKKELEEREDIKEKNIEKLEELVK